MNDLNLEHVAEIRAAEGLYRSGAVAQHYGVSVDTVQRIWAGKTYTQVKPANEPPNVWQRPAPVELKQDINTLLDRGYKRG